MSWQPRGNHEMKVMREMANLENIEKDKQRGDKLIFEYQKKVTLHKMKQAAHTCLKDI